MATLSVPIHLQDHADACGPACAQMVAAFQQPAAPLLDQRAIQPAVPQPGWATTPDQLRDMLNAGRAAGAPRYKVFITSTAAPAMNRAKASVANGWPAVALTNGGFHWEVIHGFTQGTATTMIHVRDPSPDRTLVLNLPANAPVPAHASSDTCEALNVQQGGAPADESVTPTWWNSHDFKKCGVGGAPWRNKFVMIALDVAALAQPITISLPPPGPMVPLLEPLVVDAAWRGLQGSGLLALPDWRDALSTVPAGVTHRFIRVEPLDGDQAYYLVALTDKIGRGALVGLDAATGELLWARLNPARLVRQLLTPVTAQHRRFVWGPSEATFYSPFFPLSELSSPDATPRYLRLLDRKTIHDLAQKESRPD